MSENDPMADPAAIVASGNARFTVLTPQMIRIEYSEKQAFEDRASFTVVNRKLPVPNYTVSEQDGYLYITTDALTLRYRTGENPVTNPATSDNLRITFRLNGREVVWYPGKEDALNLKGTCRTLDSSNGDNKRAEMEDGLVSRSGWAIIDDSFSNERADGGRSFALDKMDDGVDWVAERADKEALDIYFLGYGRDYRQALSDFTKIAGKIPMPPAYAFGYWYSKYQAYTSDDFKSLITEMEANDIPIDVMVIDTDWHINGWTGWSWNRDLIPNPTELLSWLHEHHVKVPLNLHPAYGVESNEDNFTKLCADLGYDPRTTTNIPWQLHDRAFYKSMFNNIIRLRENEGVDFWWLDWQQWLTSKYVDGLSETFWCNHVFYEDMKANRPDRRPAIFHRWGGLGSHRYQLGFSGDSHSNFPTLAFQPYFTATASNVGYGYWGHDLGGHVQPGDNDPELYLRWIQFGVFTPIFRTHSTNASNIERRIWKYPNFPLMLEAVKLRYALFPYIYTAAREAYDTGVSICRPLYYDYPEVSEAYRNEGEYMFGNDILVAPITEAADANGVSAKTVWLPEGEWWSAATGEMLTGGTSYGMTFQQDQIPYFYKAGSVIVNNPPEVMTVTERPSTLILKMVPGGSGSTVLYEDAGDDSGYQDGAFTTTRISQQVADGRTDYVIGPREGSFAGMPERRAYTIEILDSETPVEVTINGEAAASWTYDAEKRVATVNVPAADCGAQTTVSVAAQEGGVAAVAAGGTKVFVSGDTLFAHFGGEKRGVGLRVYNVAGSVVLSHDYSDCGIVAADLSSLCGGCYLCSLTADGIRTVKKIIK